MLWALAAVAIEHRAESLLTTTAAVVAMVLVLAAMFGPWQRETRRAGMATA
ncbi:MAG: hypothetical protein U0031_21790 [Thermomicrobiales bacterium]